MFDLLPEIQAFSAAVGAAGGMGSMGLVSYVYSKRTAIAAFFKRAESTATAEAASFRAALVNLENHAREAFSIVSSATQQVQKDVAGLKGTFADFDARFVKLETAVFGAAAPAVQAAQAGVAAVAGALNVAQAPAPAPVAPAAAQ